MPIEIVTGDITEQDVDAIVNSAAPSMLAGGGVCGAIHKAAGPELEKECVIIGHVDAGNAALTAGHQLKTPYVIHAVAPQWFGGHNREEEIMEQCYRSIFGIAEMEGFKSVAIPAMGIGSFRWPVERAIPIAIRAAQEFHRQHPEILLRFVCFTDDVTAHYLENLRQSFRVSALAFSGGYS